MSSYLARVEEYWFGMLTLYLLWSRLTDKLADKIPELICGVGALSEIKVAWSISSTGSETIAHGWWTRGCLKLIMIKRIRAAAYIYKILNV